MFAIFLIVSVHFSESLGSFALLLGAQVRITSSLDTLLDLGVVLLQDVICNQEFPLVMLKELNVARNSCEDRDTKVAPSVVGKVRGSTMDASSCQ